MNTLNSFDKFPDDARIWLYQTDRALSAEEVKLVKDRLFAFTREWAAHGNKLWATADVINPYFVAVAVNDALTPPSGCSIDASVKELKGLGSELNVDFFTRMKVTYLKDDQLHQIDFADLSQLDGETLILDPLLANLCQLRNQFPIALKDSSLGQLIV